MSDVQYKLNHYANKEVSGMRLVGSLGTITLQIRCDQTLSFSKKGTELKKNTYVHNSQILCCVLYLFYNYNYNAVICGMTI